MPIDEQSQQPTSPERHLPRRLEMAAFAQLLPLRAIDTQSPRIFNIWGEPEVGKTTFVSEFRESDTVGNSKALWLQPTRSEPIDTVEEFIRACSKTVRYPAEPDKEKKIASAIESVERGKVNPVVSDDSLLIIRSSVASNRKPYINQAAAASVGRTEVEREDIQVSVGLGESKANNQAEGFLDALPLQSLGTDLIVLFLERVDRLALPVIDWLRDYVIPAATRGAYRRNLVIILESKDPLARQSPPSDWGEWSKFAVDFRIRRMSEDDAYQLALGSGLGADAARYVYFKSQGYPGALAGLLAEGRRHGFAGAGTEAARDALSALNPNDQLQLAALCLPNMLYADELDALFGARGGKAALEWLAAIPKAPLSMIEDGKAFQLADPFRMAVLSAVGQRPDFRALRKRWSPLARLTHNLPSKPIRSKMLMLAGLLWIDDALCQSLFGEQAERIMTFIRENPTLFCQAGERFLVTDRFRPELRAAAEQMGHIGAGAVRTKAAELWNARREETRGRLAILESELEQMQKQATGLMRKQTEYAAQVRIQERKSNAGGYSESVAHEAARKSHGSLIALLAFLSVIAFVASAQVPSPYNFAALAAGLAAISVALAYVPGWAAKRKASSIASLAQNRNSPEYARKQSLELAHELQQLEDRIDAQKLRMDEQKDILDHPYVPPPSESDEA